MKKPDIAGLPFVYLHPGEFYLSERPAVVTTVLGSCISVIMYDAQSRTSAITHSQMPVCTKNNSSCIMCSEAYKFTDCSIKNILKLLESRNIILENITVKLFGGADVLSANSERSTETIGRQNIAVAIDTINKAGLKITANDTGGQQGRKIFLYTESGEIWMTRLRKQYGKEVKDEESKSTYR